MLAAQMPPGSADLAIQPPRALMGGKRTSLAMGPRHQVSATSRGWHLREGFPPPGFTHSAPQDGGASLPKLASMRSLSPGLERGHGPQLPPR